MLGKLFGGKSKFVALCTEGAEFGAAGEHEKAVAKFEEAFKVATDKDRKLEDWYRAKGMCGVSLFSLKEYKGSLNAFLDAIRACEEGGATATPTYIAATIRAAVIVGNMTDSPSDADKFIEKCLGATLKAARTDPFFLLEHFDQIDDFRRNFRPNFDFIPFFEQVAVAARRMDKPGPHIAPSLLLRVANGAGQQHREKALAWTREAIELLSARALMSEPLYAQAIRFRFEFLDASQVVGIMEHELANLRARKGVPEALLCQYCAILSLVAKELDDHAREDSYSLEAMGLMPKVPADYPLDRSEVFLMRGSVESRRGNGAQAAKALREAVAESKKGEDADPANTLQMYVLATATLAQHGHAAECRALIDEGDRFVDAQKFGHEEICEYCVARNASLQALGVHDDLVDNYMAVLEHLDDVNKLDTEGHGDVLTAYGNLLTEVGPPQEAHRHLMAAEAVIAASAGKESNGYAAVLNRQARLAAKAGNRKLATVLLERSRKLFAQTGGAGWLSKKYEREILGA